MVRGATAKGQMIQQEKEGRFANSFQLFAAKASCWMGTKWSFVGAMLIIVGWAALGPYFHYSDTWQLVVNTATTIVTFLMVFLIQNTQNRDARAIHLKLDEVIRAMYQARNEPYEANTPSCSHNRITLLKSVCEIGWLWIPPPQ